MGDWAINVIAVVVLPFAWAEYWWKEVRSEATIKVRGVVLNWRLRGKPVEYGQMVRLRLLRRILRGLKGTSAVMNVAGLVEMEIERRKAERNWRTGVQ